MDLLANVLSHLSVDSLSETSGKFGTFQTFTRKGFVKYLRKKLGNHLATFFCDRFSDLQSVAGASKGLLIVCQLKRVAKDVMDKIPER